MSFSKPFVYPLSAALLATLLSACNGSSTPTPTPTPTPNPTPTPTPGDCKTLLKATPEAIEEAFITLAESRRAVANQWKGKSFEEFEKTVYREPKEVGGKYIVNGDVAIADIAKLKEFFEREVQQAGPLSRGLIVHQSNGADAVWPADKQRDLSYCVSKDFGSRYSEVVAAMEAATKAWESAANINFSHDTTQDSSCNATNNKVVFDVNPVNSGGNYLARAFFPDDIRVNRNVLIDDSSFGLDPNGKLSLVGILRHELGHTLGFRHEHTRPESGTCFEDSNWCPLTSYDAFSVMHYPQCNGKGDWSLTLTKFDSNGVACQYGAASGFTIDTSICTPK